MPGPARWRIAVISILTVADLARPQETGSLRAEYGAAPGRFENGAFQHDANFPPGVYGVPLASERLTAFDTDSTQVATCTRMDRAPVDLPNGSPNFYRFRCEGNWTSRSVVFLDSAGIRPTRAEMLEWKKLDSEPATQAHTYMAQASPRILNGNVLVTTAWFTGEYPPRKERDESRGDEIAFGHYRIMNRALYLGASARQPLTFLYRSDEAKEVTDPFDRAFLPEDSSEKYRARFDAIYETRSGYILRLAEETDFEGAGVTETTHLYAYENGKWRLLTRAERIRMY